MGIWTKLFGGADGIREAMCESYHKHVKLVQQGRLPANDSPHASGLYGALGSRYRLSNKPFMEVVMWGELAPFLAMREGEAVKALAEYVVFQETPGEARVTWLKSIINSALRSPRAPSQTELAGIGLRNQVAWCALIEPETMKVLESSRWFEEFEKFKEFE